MRVQWATSHARMERWAEEVELLQEEMRRVVMFLQWKAEDWLAKQDARLVTAPSSVQSGLHAYAQKQAAIHRNLAISFSRLWYPTLFSYHLKHSWITDYMKKHGIPLPEVTDPAPRTQGIFKASILNETDRGPTQAGTTPPIQIQGLSGTTTNRNAILLEEVLCLEDHNESEGNHYSVAWDSPSRFAFNSDIDNDSPDNSDDDGSSNNNSSDYSDHNNHNGYDDSDNPDNYNNSDNSDNYDDSDNYDNYDNSDNAYYYNDTEDYDNSDGYND